MSKFLFYSISTNYFISILLIICCSEETQAWWPREYPRIGLHRWLELDQEDHSMGGHWRSDFENITKNYLSITDQGQTFIVSSQITGLGFECNATYPVNWVLGYPENSDYPAFYTRVRYFRSNHDVFSERSNTFISSLDMFGDSSGISGNYSCVSVQYPADVLKSIYVYWQGTNPSNLVLGGKSVEAQSKDGHYLILPCRVTRPDVVVNLYREVNSEWVSAKSPFIKFNPKIGFRINLYQYNGAYGRFKCAVGDDEDEALIINVKKGIIDPDLEFNNTMDSNATIFFNKTSQEIVCCSNSSKAPKLHSLFCVENFSCDIRKHQLHSIVNNGKRLHNQSCTSERIYTKDSGLLRCVGDGIDVMRNFYSDIPTKKNNHTANLYFNWDEIIPENMVEISATSSRGPIFEHQNLTISCDTAFNYFSDGMQWALRWKNQSLKFFPAPANNNMLGVLDMYENSVSFQSLRIQLTLDMSEIICFVPVWNDTKWINKSFSLNVQETKQPHFNHPEPEEYQWKLNSTDQILECRVSGSPSPTIKWKKFNKTIVHENNLSFKRQNGTSSLKIHRVSHDVQGIYKCTATNFGGTVEKIMHVYVEEPSAGLGTVGFILLILTILTLIVVSLGFGWKMQLQKNIIDHLAGIVFRDVNTNTNNTSDSTNTTSNEGSTRGNSDINPFPSSVG